MSTDTTVAELYRAQRPESQKLYERASQALAGAVGHDLRWFEPTPLYIERASGGRKWDVDGVEYVDFLLGNGAMLLGHAEPSVIEAIRESLSRGTHFGSDHPAQIAWAELVQSMVPSAERVRFVNSGTEATALAFRLARAFTNRPKILRLEGHFHGWHDEAVHGFALPFDADGSLGVPPHARNQVLMAPDRDPEAISAALAHDRGIGAIVLEPSGASWGRVPMDVGFLRALRELTSRFGVVLIFDEVVSGFRFDPGGVQKLVGVTPDLTCLAKILAGGMPGGAVAGRAEIMRLFDHSGDPRRDRHGRVVHLGTFNAAPPSAAAGVATLCQVATGAPIERANRQAARLRELLDDVLERHSIAGYVYGESSTFHVYFETDRERIAAAASRADLRTADSRRLKGMPGDLVSGYQRHLRHRGVDVMSSTGGVLSSAHTDADLEWATAAFEDSILALSHEGRLARLD